MITSEDKKFLVNCVCMVNNIYAIVREYRHSFNVNTDEYIHLKGMIDEFHSIYTKLTVDQVKGYLLDILDYILDNKLKEFSKDDCRYKVWNSVYDCVRETYFDKY